MDGVLSKGIASWHAKEARGHTNHGDRTDNGPAPDQGDQARPDVAKVSEEGHEGSLLGSQLGHADVYLISEKVQSSPTEREGLLAQDNTDIDNLLEYERDLCTLCVHFPCLCALN